MARSNRLGGTFAREQHRVQSTDLALNPVSISTRRKLASILLSVAIFATLAGLASRANSALHVFMAPFSFEANDPFKQDPFWWNATTARAIVQAFAGDR